TMARELFDEVCIRPGRVRSRRSSLVIVSLVAHAIVISAFLISSLVPTEALPIPQRGGAIYVTPDVVLASLPPSTRLRPSNGHPRSGADSATAIPAPTTPLHAPSGVSDETGLENRSAGPGSGADSTVLGEGAGLAPGTLGPTQQPEAPTPVA